MANEETTEYWGGRFERLEDYGVDGRLNLRSVKLFTDGKPGSLRSQRIASTGYTGALGSWGAALLEPYTDNPSTSGLMRTSEAALKRTVTRFWEDGWGVVGLLRSLPRLWQKCSPCPTEHTLHR